ncbi:hypothetical protein C8J57DRAFT_1515983 [Mycena rebaudengoi]|nr:hypothetical protein C8J57DRAFT_1515983 [Mycena rebaudengoi]
MKCLDSMQRSIYAHLSEFPPDAQCLPIRSYREIPRFVQDNKYNIDLENRALFLTGAVENALVYVCKKDIINLESLTLDTNGPFKDVEWMPGAEATDVLELAGQHRRRSLVKYLDPVQIQADKLQKQIVNAQKGSPQYLKMKEEHRSLHDRLREQGKWLVAYYSDEMLDDEEGQTMQLALSTNNRVTSMQDSPLVHFNRVLTSVRKANSDLDRRQSLELTAELEGHGRTLVKKYPEIVHTFAKIHACAPFTQNSVHPQRLIDSKEVVWGVLERFLQGLYFQVACISGNRTYDFDSSLWPDAPERLQYIMYEYFFHPSDSQLEVWEDIASETAKLSDDAFETHLADKMGYFGQKDSAEWKNAFALYTDKFKRELALWVKCQLDADKGPRSKKTLDLENVMTKVERILDDGFLSEAPFLPSLAGGIPILCPKFVVALTDMLLKLAPAFMLLFTHLQYAQYSGQTEPFDWAHTDPKEVAEYVADGSQFQAGDHIHTTFLELIQLVFEQRTQVLLPRMNDIKAILGQKVAKEDQLTPEALEKSVAQCKKWSEACQAANPQTPVTELTSSFNWLAKDNNQLSTWGRYIQSLFHQAVIDFRLNEGLYTADPSLLLFHKQAFDIIRAQPGLADFPCWASIPSIEESELTVPTFKDFTVLAVDQALKRAELQSKFTSRMASYVASLAKQGSLGITLKRIASALHRDVAAVETDDTEHKFSTADDHDVDMELDVDTFTSDDWESMLGFPVEWATEQDVQRYLHKRKRKDSEADDDDDSLSPPPADQTPPPPPGNQQQLLAGP